MGYCCDSRERRHPLIADPMPFNPLDFLASATVAAWPALLGALLVFLARVCDVSLGTLRSIYTLRGRKLTSTAIALVEVTIFIVAISSVLSGERSVPKMIGYVLGYATGVYVGISLEGYIASGWAMLRIMTRENPDVLVQRLRDAGDAVTRVMGEGRDGPVPVLFVVARRKRAKAVLRLVRELSPQAFVTVDSVGQAIGGTLKNVPFTPFRMMVRK